MKCLGILTGSDLSIANGQWKTVVAVASFELAFEISTQTSFEQDLDLSVYPMAMTRRCRFLATRP